MLVHKLQEIRMQLLRSIDGLSSEQLNIRPGKGKGSISQILYHLYVTEKAKTTLIESLQGDRENNSSIDTETHKSPPAYFQTKNELLQMLHDSRSDYLQLLMKKEKANSSLICMKTLTESIYLHEQRHAAQIRLIKRTILFSAG